MVLDYGDFKPGVGGGLCHLPNDIFWKALYTTLEVTERCRHSYDVFLDVNRKQPFGSGATCVYNYRNLQIANKTDFTFQLKLHLTRDDFWARWLCNIDIPYRYEVYEKNFELYIMGGAGIQDIILLPERYTEARF